MSYAGDGLNEKLLLMAFVGNDYMVVWCIVLFCVWIMESEKKTSFPCGRLVSTILLYGFICVSYAV